MKLLDVPEHLTLVSKFQVFSLRNAFKVCLVVFWLQYSVQVWWVFSEDTLMRIMHHQPYYYSLRDETVWHFRKARPCCM